jgi:L-ascorbate metabolism protein UlaG (beta-lactamase superfamily)
MTKLRRLSILLPVAAAILPASASFLHASGPSSEPAGAAVPAAISAPAIGFMPTYDGVRFSQPEPREMGLGSMLKKTFGSKRGAWRKFIDLTPGEAPPSRVCDGELRVTMVNHATLLVQMDGVNLLTDPIWANRSVPTVGVKRHRPPGLRFEDLPPIDAIVISHNHQDHMDLPSLRRLTKEHHPAVYAGLGNAIFLARKDVPGAKDLDWWQTVEIAPGVTITAVPARHHSGRFLFDKNRTLWAGYVLSGPSGSVYFAGDTGWGDHFAAIGQRFPDLRLAILPIGGFKPVWYMREVHIGPEDALEAMRQLGAETMIPMHFGTFPNGDEGEAEAALTLQALVDENEDRTLQDRVVILDNGQSWLSEPKRRETAPNLPLQAVFEHPAPLPGL